MSVRRWLPGLLLWTVILALTAGAAAVWAIGPLRPIGGAIELLAFGPDNRFGQEVRLFADSSAPDIRFPLLLGISNGGTRATVVDTVHVSIPGRFVLLDGTGRPIPGRRDDAGPLVRYTFVGDAEPVEPGTLPAVLPGADRLYLAPAFAGLACRVGPNDRPLLEPAPPYAPEELARVDAFYSIETGSARRRTGTLRLLFDPDVIARLATVDSLNAGPVSTTTDTSALAMNVEVGRTDVLCGEPGAGEIITSTVWSTRAGGRVLSLAIRDTARLRLFDVDGDGQIERETWDADLDGRFESWRSVRYAIPAFLLPPPPVDLPDEAETIDGAAADTTQIAVPPADTAPPAPVRPRPRPDSARVTPRPDSAAGDTARADTVRVDTMRVDTMRVDTLRAGAR